MRAEGKAAILCVLGALAWFAPYLAPGKALLGMHPTLFPPFEEGVSAVSPLSKVQRDEIAAAAHPLYGDKLLQHDPEVRFSAESLKQGLLPAWNPYVLGGVPHLATGLPSTLHPLMGLSLLVAPPRCYAVIAAVQTALGAFFFFLMLRAFGVAPLAAGAGALLFGGSGWMSVHQEYFQLTAAATWLPLALYGTKKLLDGRGGAFALGAAIACAFLSGFPQIAFYCLLAPALLVASTLVVRLAQKRATARAAARDGLAFGLVVVLGLVGAAPQLLATAELVPHSTRRQIDAQILEEQALPPVGLIAALLPDLLVQPRTAAELAQGLPAESLFAKALLGTGTSRTNYFETTFALGPAALLLALLGLFGGRKEGRGFFGLLTAVGLLLVLPGPLLRASASLPGLNIGDPKRALFLVQAALAALAALAMDRLLSDPDADADADADADERAALRRWRKRAFIASVAGVVLLGGAALCAALAGADGVRDWALPRIAAGFGVAQETVLQSVPASEFTAASRLLVRELLFASGGLLLFALVLAWRHRAGSGARFSGAALYLVLVLPLAGIWWAADRPIPLAGIDAEPPLVRHVAGSQEGGGGVPRPSGRILRLGTSPSDVVWPPKLPMNLGVRDAQGYVAVFLAGWRDLFEAVAPGSTETVGIRPLADPNLLALPLFDLLDVEYAFASLPRTLEAPAIPGWVIEPIKTPPDGPTADRPTRVTLWRNPDAVGRAYVVPRVRIMASDEELLAALTRPDFAPREVALLLEDDANRSFPPNGNDSDWRVSAGQDGAIHLEFEPAHRDNATAPPKVELVSAAPDDLDFAVESSGGLLVNTECWYPGWSARIDGADAPLLRVDHVLRGVPLPTGKHRVQLHYTPKRLLLGLLLVPVALAGLVFAGLTLCRHDVVVAPGRGTDVDRPA